MSREAFENLLKGHPDGTWFSVRVEGDQFLVGAIAKPEDPKPGPYAMRRIQWLRHLSLMK